MPTTTLLVLISQQSLNREVVSRQDRALTVLANKNFKVETLDGADAANRERRNELFGISGVRAQYPQFFLLQEGRTTFWGDWERFEVAHETQQLEVELKECRIEEEAPAVTAAASAEKSAVIPPDSTTDFPVIDLVPKKETNVLSFLEKYPQYDGRNVVIGILDTGIDPGAHGIFNDANGAPKLIDVVDCTGSGDVDVSHSVPFEKTIEVLSGRTLTLPDEWKVQAFPGEEKVQIRLGIKVAYELFPGKLKDRVQKERQKQLNQTLEGYRVEIRSRLAEQPDKTKKEDLEARLEALADWQDPGPLYDCLVFYDGVNYRAVVVPDDVTDLSTLTPLTDFDKERQFSTLGVVDQMNYAVHFYQNAKVLSLITDASPHGTHVAGIAAGADGLRSGVAPGAQLISFKIGDSRLGSMETGTSIARALAAAAKRCDVINLSYGEGCAIPNRGRCIELANEIVNKHNVVFVSSAGNNGPALSTVGAPGGSSSACIGVAAYVSPDMMKADYSIPVSGNDSTETQGFDDPIGTTYTWSSVGPTADGDYGVDVTAPGGAITSVSNWCLQKSMLMNGTSMSSPHATGCVALLISACKAEGIPVSSARIRKALKNSCRQLSHLSMLQQGAGMIQVDKAFEYLQANKAAGAEDIQFEVTIDNRAGSPRGVYLRQPEHSSTKQSFSVNVEPSFRDEDGVSDEGQKSKIDFEMKFKLESTTSWVSTPPFFMLMNTGRSFKIEVDPTKLEPGVHTAAVEGMDVSVDGRRVLFSVPITVVKPLPSSTVTSLPGLDFSPAEVKRFFLVPPLGSSWMDVVIKDCRRADDGGDSSTRLLVLHTVQMLPHAAYRDFEKYAYHNLRPAQTVITSIPVEPGVTCELNLARYWSTLGTTKVDVDVQFHGIRPSPNNIDLRSGIGGQLVRLYSDVGDVTVNPSASLTSSLSPARPKAGASVSPLIDERDVWPSPNRKLHALVLEYEFTQEESGSITPRAPVLQGVLYEAGFESQMMLLFNGDKKYLGAADAWPSSVTAPKGTMKVRLQVRHEDPAKLEPLKDMTIWIERELDKELSLSCYSTKEDTALGSTAFKKRLLQKGNNCAVFIAEPVTSKLPSNVSPGCILTGKVSYESNDSSLPGAGKRPGGFPVTYVVGPNPEKSSDSDSVEPEDPRTAAEKMNDEARDKKVAFLGNLSSSDKEAGKFEELFDVVQKEYPDHIPLLMAKLKYLDTHEKRTEKLADIIQTCESVISRISEDELAKHFGKKSDPEDPKALKIHNDFTAQKSQLTEALARMALAYADSKDAKFDETLKKLKEWVNIESSTKYATLVMERDSRAENYGLVLKQLDKLLSKDVKEKDLLVPMKKSDIFKKRSEVLALLGYDALVAVDSKTRVIASPKGYALF